MKHLLIRYSSNQNIESGEECQSVFVFIELLNCIVILKTANGRGGKSSKYAVSLLTRAEFGADVLPGCGTAQIG
jgi:hypothetical protein